MSLPRGRQARARQILQRLEDKQELTQPKFNKDEAEHRYRGLVLVAVFLMLVFELIVISLAWLRYGIDVEEVKDIAAIILSPTFTLFGAIVGFYFSRGK